MRATPHVPFGAFGRNTVFEMDFGESEKDFLAALEQWAALESIRWIPDKGPCYITICGHTFEFRTMDGYSKFFDRVRITRRLPWRF